MLKDILEDQSNLCGAMRGRYLDENGVRKDYGGKTKQYLEIRDDNKTNCLTTVQKDNIIIRDKSKCVRSGGRGSVDRHEWDSVDKNHLRKLTPLECSRLQTIPDNYFYDSNGKNIISDTQIFKCCGNGWTVDVISHIFNSLDF